MQVKLYLWCLQHDIQAFLRSNSYGQFDLISNVLDLRLADSGLLSDAGDVLRDPRWT